MGDARRRAKRQAQLANFCRPMEAARFNLYSIGARRSAARLMSEELSYWSNPEESLLGMVFRDRTDDDYNWMILARDRVGRFRCVDLTCNYARYGDAVEALQSRIKFIVENEDIKKFGDQADEPNEPVDLLAVPPGADESKLHPFFKILRDTSGRAPARAVLREIGPWLAPSDPHFVSEFQFAHFDQRLWELYLWAAFRELGFDITQPEAPDFLCSAPGIEFSVEATTVSASEKGALANHPNPKTPEEMREFLAGYMPIKFGSSLTSKLNKKTKAGENYWDLGIAANKPFILAIADFHKPGSMEEVGSMTYTHSALWPYLYGHRIDWEMVDGKLVARAVKNSDHRFGDKVVPSGFFDLPGAENISAVLFSNAGTLAKFDRMGVAAGFALPDHLYIRNGIRFDPAPDAVEGVPFREIIKAGTQEFWSDELQIFHNPNAKHPIDEYAFAGITQYYFKDGEQYSITPEGSVLYSHTIIIQPSSDLPEKE